MSSDYSSDEENNQEYDENFINPLDQSDSDDNDEIKISENEEEQINEELEEMELGKLIQAKTRLANENKLNIKREKMDRKKIQNKLEEKNKDKSKNEPKEFSALFKPKKNFISDLNSEKIIKRDPRFDVMSGELNNERFKKNFDFVHKEANDYLNKIKELKKKKERKQIKIEDEEYNLMKKQINFVKGWIKSKEYDNVKEKVEKEFKYENRERFKKGLNPVYVKPSLVKKIVHKTHNNQRTEAQSKKYLKRKLHREISVKKKNEKVIF
jgi:ribosomal RNA-processing protein 36